MALCNPCKKSSVQTSGQVLDVLIGHIGHSLQTEEAGHIFPAIFFYMDFIVS